MPALPSRYAGETEPSVKPVENNEVRGICVCLLCVYMYGAPEVGFNWVYGAPTRKCKRCQCSCSVCARHHHYYFNLSNEKKHKFNT